LHRERAQDPQQDVEVGVGLDLEFLPGQARA
jgi:hypothetical protein